jgi:hypothetical protein
LKSQKELNAALSLSSAQTNGSKKRGSQSNKNFIAQTATGWEREKKRGKSVFGYEFRVEVPHFYYSCAHSSSFTPIEIHFFFYCYCSCDCNVSAHTQSRGFCERKG